MAETNDLTILQASEKWPDSKAHAFKLEGQKPTVSYFRIEEPIFVKGSSTLRCRVKCVKFDSEDGYLVVTNTPIKNADVIKDMTIKEFVDGVLTKMNEFLQDPEKNVVNLIPYENLGFYKQPETPTDFDAKASEIFQKPN